MSPGRTTESIACWKASVRTRSQIIVRCTSNSAYIGSGGCLIGVRTQASSRSRRRARYPNLASKRAPVPIPDRAATDQRAEWLEADAVACHRSAKGFPMGFRRRTRRRALIAGAAIAHHEDRKYAQAEQQQAYDQPPA